MINKTFGAPFGAVTARGKSGFDSLALRPITPSNGGAGIGRIVAPVDGGGASWASVLVERPMQQLTNAAIATVSSKHFLKRMDVSINQSSSR
jgi:hypothetical protein